MTNYVLDRELINTCCRISSHCRIKVRYKKCNELKCTLRTHTQYIFLFYVETMKILIKLTCFSAHVRVVPLSCLRPLKFGHANPNYESPRHLDALLRRNDLKFVQLCTETGSKGLKYQFDQNLDYFDRLCTSGKNIRLGL